MSNATTLPADNASTDIGALPITFASFPKVKVTGKAMGEQKVATWKAFTDRLKRRREGVKDGPCFAPTIFTPEPDGRVRRTIATATQRTLIVLDIESDKATGEVPPPVARAAQRIAESGLAAALYTSHSNTQDAPRFRIVMPLSRPIAAHLPVVPIAAEWLGLAGVLDRSKLGPASVFLFPSCAPGAAWRIPPARPAVSARSGL